MTDADWQARRRELLEEEERVWDELEALVEGLDEEDIISPGYYEEGWTLKDALAHIGSWLAEAGIALEQLRMGTYRGEDFDVEVLNQQCLLGLKDVPIDVVRTQAKAARTRMRSECAALPGPSDEAERWIRKAGVEHYLEHLPRLRDWVETLRVRGAPSQKA